MQLDALVATDKYPVATPHAEAYQAAVAQARAELLATGCAVLKDFISPVGLNTLGREIRERKPATHYSTEAMNPYFHTVPDPGFPDHHPVNTFIERSSGFIPGDAWEQGTACRYVFEHSMVGRLLADCLDLQELFPYHDPLAGLTANILDPGQQFAWHFDTNDFAVTVLIQAADQGGLFQYVPGIRSSSDEGFAAIQSVLEGNESAVTTLDLRPGDLQIFRGRYSLHRVTRVADGSTPRHAAIFAYTAQAGVIGRVERTRQLFGRVLPEHIAAETERVRGDALLD